MAAKAIELAEVGGNLVREWRGSGLPLSAGMGCAVAFTCPCGCLKIHGDRTSVAYSPCSHCVAVQTHSVVRFEGAFFNLTRD